MFRKLLALLILIALVLTACGTPAAPVQSAAQTSSNTASQDLFALNCGECHGKDGSGTDEAPAVFGHTAEQITQQVRTPAGDMKAIPPDKLSDADLALIVQYVTGLSGKAAHSESVKPGNEERVHLMAAYEAIKDHEKMDRQAAIDHLEQAVALASGEASNMYEDMVASIKAEKAGNARHELKDLLGLEEAH